MRFRMQVNKLNELCQHMLIKTENKFMKRLQLHSENGQIFMWILHCCFIILHGIAGFHRSWSHTIDAN